MFKNIFGSSKKKEQVPSTQESIQKLRESEEMLIKKQEFLEKKVEAELNLAKQHGTKNKRAALQALKRKKQYEKQLVQLDGVLSTLDFQRQALENANTNANILQVLGDAAKALKKAHNSMDIDQVHDLLEDVAEQNEIANEISDAISNPVGLRNDIDESELLAELEELEQEELEKALADATPVISNKLPTVPTHEIAASQNKKKEAEADLDDLRAWAES
ncbi:GH13992p [Strongyloides ratti]|uniref:GH13992p n=1 Tax=Strongyloides ratti TaxID=34506 RepID=A0A090LII4_STRRB|nr:GH13992p [Strongyloides ratti]CEF67295.1 GH13992p [Strongyloides ratti]